MYIKVHIHQGYVKLDLEKLGLITNHSEVLNLTHSGKQHQYVINYLYLNNRQILSEQIQRVVSSFSSHRDLSPVHPAGHLPIL